MGGRKGPRGRLVLQGSHPPTWSPQASWARQGVTLVWEQGRDRDGERPLSDVTSCTHVVDGQRSWIIRTLKNGSEHPVIRGVQASVLDIGVELLGQGVPTS